MQIHVIEKEMCSIILNRIKISFSFSNKDLFDFKEEQNDLAITTNY